MHAVPQAQALVGGTTAINLDVQRAAVRDRNIIIPIVLVVVFLILMLLLRAIVAPLLLIATVVLSFASALGASALVFRHIFGFNGADAGLPLFVFVFLVALGIDYNIFLMTRVREEAARLGTRKGALIGLAATGGVITSAGLVLAGTFLVLATLPLTAFAEIGFAVALGVLLDTIVVRSVLVTAVLRTPMVVVSYKRALATASAASVGTNTPSVSPGLPFFIVMGTAHASTAPAANIASMACAASSPVMSSTFASTTTCDPTADASDAPVLPSTTRSRFGRSGKSM